MFVMLVFTIAEGNVAKNSCLKLGNLFLEDSKVFISDLENLSSILVKFDCLSICAFFEFKLCFFFGGIDLLLDLVKLWLQFLLFLGVDG